MRAGGILGIGLAALLRTVGAGSIRRSLRRMTLLAVLAALAGLALLAAAAAAIAALWLWLSEQLGPVHAALIIAAGLVILGLAMLLILWLVARGEAAWQKACSNGSRFSRKNIRASLSWPRSWLGWLQPWPARNLRARNRTTLRGDARPVRGRYPASFFFKSSLSSAGLALPPLAFITWPTKKPNSFSLPARYSASLSACWART